MKLAKQILLLAWVKEKTQINPKRLSDNLTRDQLSELLGLLDKLKSLGGVFTPQEVIEEYLEDNGVDLSAPKKCSSGQKIDMVLLTATHPKLDNGCVSVFLSHLLLAHGFKNTRSNKRLLTKHFKELGYQLSKKELITSPHRELSEVVQLKEAYEPKFPSGLDVSEAEPKKRNAHIVDWLYEGHEVQVGGEAYTRKKVNARWEAFMVRRMHELYESSELPYLYKHRVQRGVFDDVAEVRMIFQLAIRDVFKPMNIIDWVTLSVGYELPLFDSADSQHKEVLVSTCTDSVLGILNKTLVDGKPLAIDPKMVSGWLSLLVISYVEDALSQFKGMRCHTS